MLELVTYTTENVSGLDVSSPVRYRGVPVGRVVGPARRPVAPEQSRSASRCSATASPRFGFDVQQLQAMAVPDMFPKLRAQVVSNPVTGEVVLAARSGRRILRRRSRSTSRRIGPTCRRCPRRSRWCRIGCRRFSSAPRRRCETIREIVARIPDSLDRSDRFFTNVERIVRESELPALSADVTDVLRDDSNDADRAADRRSSTELIGTGGTLVHARRRCARRDQGLRSCRQRPRPRATRWTRTSLAADDLRRSLPAIRDSLEQLRELARMLEEQPESVVYGPRPAGANPR